MNQTPYSVLFFGSSLNSLSILKSLWNNSQSSSLPVTIAAVITPPPRPTGRKQIITPSPVEQWAQQHTITTLNFATNPSKPIRFENEEQVVDTLQSFNADLIISASFGQLIPWNSIEKATFGGVNVHPSLLPRWRGADPIPWTILAGDHQTGVSIVTLSKDFDEGRIIAQKKIPLTGNEERESLRHHLFELGAELLQESLPEYFSGSNTGQAQDPSKAVYARRLTRNDGFIDWKLIQKAREGKEIESDDIAPFLQGILTHSLQHESKKIYNAQLILQSLRALSPWPGVWTIIPTKDGQKRLKILSAHTSSDTPDVLVLDDVQLEGKTPTTFSPSLLSPIT